jgi:hypothetical protein
MVLHNTIAAQLYAQHDLQCQQIILSPCPPSLPRFSLSISRPHPFRFQSIPAPIHPPQTESNKKQTERKQNDLHNLPWYRKRNKEQDTTGLRIPLQENPAASHSVRSIIIISLPQLKHLLSSPDRQHTTPSSRHPPVIASHFIPFIKYPAPNMTLALPPPNAPSTSTNYQPIPPFTRSPHKIAEEKSAMKPLTAPG